MKMISLEKYREIFTFPVKDYYLELGFDLEKEPFEISGLEFIKAYEKRKYDARLYPEVFFLLNELSKRGISHSILSAQHQALLNDLTQFYNIHDYFISIIGLDNHFAKSKIENGIEWMSRTNLNHQEILMIGDTNHDFEVARAIGIDCILLSHGHHCSSRLKKTGTLVFQNLMDVLSFFKIELN